MAEGGSGRGPTSTAYEYSPELAMIETKMRSLLSRNERRVLRKLAQAYASAQLNINQFVEALLHLLSSTPEKASFLVELRELVRNEDQSEYDHRVFSLREPLLLYRSVQFQSNNSFDFESAVNDHHHHHLESVVNDDNVGDDRYDDGGTNDDAVDGTAADDEDFYMTDFDYQRQSLLQVERQHSVRDAVNRAFPQSPTSTAAAIAESNSSIHLHQHGTSGRGINLHPTCIPFTTADMSSFAFPTASSASLTLLPPLLSSTSAAAAQTASTKIPVGALPPQQQRLLPSNGKMKMPQVKQHLNGITTSNDQDVAEVVVRKTSTLLGLAIEGGSDTRHALPRIISIDGKGTAFEAAGLKIGQTILRVNGTRTRGLTHAEVARLIATSYADRSVPDLKLTMTASTEFRPNANYQPEG